MKSEFVVENFLLLSTAGSNVRKSTVASKSVNMSDRLENGVQMGCFILGE